MNITEQVGPEGAAARIAAFGPGRFYNRELSWLNFNKRVMEEAQNERHPLLERLRFLSISANNLDEFYMVRVAGLRAQVVAGIETPSQDGLTPSEQLDRINESVAELTANQQETWVTLEALLGEAEIHVLSADQLSGQERDWLELHFLNHIFPVLTPIAVDPAHPFPFIPNFGFTLGLELVREGSFRTMHALLPIPPRATTARTRRPPPVHHPVSISRSRMRPVKFSCRGYRWAKWDTGATGIHRSSALAGAGGGDALKGKA